MFLDPKIAHAESFSKIAANPTISSITSKVMNALVIPAIEALFVFTVLVFIWGVFGLITHAGDSTARETGQKHILWGVVGMFIMISAYGIIRLIGNTVGVGDPFQ